MLPSLASLHYSQEQLGTLGELVSLRRGGQDESGDGAAGTEADPAQGLEGCIVTNPAALIQRRATACRWLTARRSTTESWPPTYPTGVAIWAANLHCPGCRGRPGLRSSSSLQRQHHGRSSRVVVPCSRVDQAGDVRAVADRGEGPLMVVLVQPGRQGLSAGRLVADIRAKAQPGLP
jgi:hypothetical protein